MTTTWTADNKSIMLCHHTLGLWYSESVLQEGSKGRDGFASLRRCNDHHLDTEITKVTCSNTTLGFLVLRCARCCRSASKEGMLETLQSPLHALTLD
jgi:hypothetical protein